MIHKNFPGGPTELEVYRQEVINGLHDHWIDPKSGKWTYTYHQRLAAYWPAQIAANKEWVGLADVDDPYNDSLAVDQLDYIVNELIRSNYSRRAQAITWMPTCDPETSDPPCLQRIWARIVHDGELWLNMNTHWRSRDLWKAWFMNAFAMVGLQRSIALEVSNQIGREVKVGRYCDISDSLHIYGSYRNDKFENEIKKMRDGDWESRSWDSEVLRPMFEETRQKLLEDPDCYAKGDG